MVAQIVGQYERDKLAGKRFAQQYGLSYDVEETPTVLFKDGKPVGKINADVNIVKDSTGTVNDQIRAADALAKKKQAAAEAAANKANAAAEARDKRLESLFDSMFSALTKPTGVKLCVPSKGRTQPFFTGMYGYNGVIRIKGLDQLNGIYLGPTNGGGIMVKQYQNHNYWRISLNVPFRSQEMLNDWEAIKARPDVRIESALLPIKIGVGFHFTL